VFVVIVLNALWAVDSRVAAGTRWVETTPLGELFVIGHAVIIRSKSPRWNSSACDGRHS